MSHDSSQATRFGARLRIFVSYSRQDLLPTDAIVDALIGRGFDILIDRRDLPYGEEWRKEISELIRASDTVLWLVSTHSVSSKWCRWELGEVTRLNKRILPVVISAVSINELPETISDIHLLPAEGEFSLDTHLDILTQTLSTNRDWLKEATRLADRAQKWLASERSNDHLIQGKALREAQQWMDEHPPAVPPPSQEQLDFIVASQRAQKRRSRVLTAGLSAVAVLALIAAAISSWLYLGREDALVEARRQTQTAVAAQENEAAQRGIAQQNEKTAASERDRALQTESLFLTDLAQQQTARGDATTGMLLSLAALPDPITPVRRPYVAPAELQLFLAGSATRELKIWQLPTLAGNVSLSSTGEQLLHDDYESAAALWETSTGRKIHQFTRRPNTLAPFFSPDGKVVGVLEQAHRLTIIDAASGDTRLSVDVSEEHGPIRYVQLSNDAAVAAIGTVDNRLRFYDLKTTAVISVLPGDFEGTFSPDGSLFVTGHSNDYNQSEGYTGYAIVWDVRSGTEKFRLRGDQGWVTLVKFNVDGDRLLTATSGTAVCCEFRSLIHLWDSKTGNLIATLKGHERSMRSVEFSPDGRWIVSTSNDGTVRLWHGHDGSAAKEVLVRHVDNLRKSSFGSNSGLIATIAYDGTLWLTRLPQNKRDNQDDEERPVTHAIRGALGISSDIRFIGASPYFATISDDRAIRIWDGRPGAASFRSEEHGMGERVEIDEARSAPDAKQPTFIERDWRPGAIIAQQSGEAPASAERQVLNLPNSQTATIKNGILRIAVAKTGNELFVSNPAEIIVRRAAFSVDGTSVVLVGDPPGGSSDETLVQFRRSSTWATYAEEQIFDATESLVVDSAKGLAAIGFRRGMLRVWGVTTGQRIAERYEPLRRPLAMAIFSPSSQFLVTASREGVAVLWETEHWQPVATLHGHSQPLTGVAFDPERNRLLTTSEDWTARVWSLPSGEQLAKLRSHAGEIGRPRFLENGTIVEAQSKTQVLRWQVEPTVDTLFRHIVDQIPRCLSPEQRALYNLDPAPPMWCLSGRKWPYQPAVFLARANDFMRNGKFSDAVGAFDWAIRLEPNDAEVYFRRGQAQEARADFEKAISDYGQAIRLNPHETKYRYHRASSLFRTGDLQSAIEDLDAVVAVDDRNATALALRATVLLRLGKHDDSLRDIRLAVQQDARSPLYLHVYAAALLETSQPAEAIEQLDRSLQRHGNPIQYYLRARANEQLGHMRLALADYSIALRPIRNVDGWEAEQNRGAVASARASLARLGFTRDRALAEEFWKRGLQLFDSENYADAAAAFTESLTHSPAGDNAFNVRAFCYLYLGRFDSAIADFSEIIRLGRNTRLGHSNRAFALWKSGRLEEALIDAQRAVQLQHDNAYSLTHRGSILRDLGQLDAALRDFDKVIGLKSDFIGAWVGRAKTYQRQGKTDAAIADYRKALALKAADAGDREQQEEAQVRLGELIDGDARSDRRAN